MPRKKKVTPAVTLVGVRGAKLPIETGILVDETNDDFVMEGAVKVGRGRGQKTMLRTYWIPKSSVQYRYTEVEIDAADAPLEPVAASAPGVSKAPAKKDAPKKATTRKPRAKKAAAAAAEGDAPKKRGPGRPKGPGKKKAPAKKEGTKTKRGPGRPRGSGKKKAPAKKAPPAKKEAAPKKKAPVSRANALFEDDF